MPEVSRFFGIVIRMYYDEHLPPHFHAIYEGSEAQVGIDSIKILEGETPASRSLNGHRMGRASPTGVDEQLGAVAE